MVIKASFAIVGAAVVTAVQATVAIRTVVVVTVVGISVVLVTVVVEVVPVAETEILAVFTKCFVSSLLDEAGCHWNCKLLTASVFLIAYSSRLWIMSKY